MRYRWDKKYLYWGMTALIVICASMCFYYFLFRGVQIHDGIIKFVKMTMPIIFGFVIAYLVTPIVNTVEKKIVYRFIDKIKLNRSKKVEKRVRYFSIIASLFFVFLLIYGFFSMLIPQLVKSIQSLAIQFPTYLSNLMSWLNTTVKNNPEVHDYFQKNEITLDSSEIIAWFNKTIIPNIENLGNLVSTLYSGVFGVMRTLFQFMIGIIISVYLMGAKETFAGQGKKILYAFFDVKNANRIIRNTRFVHRTFINYLSGQITDSVIVGFICFLGTSFLHTPYAIFVSVIVGITNLVPFFGPYLGAIPCGLLILIIDPLQSLYFVIFIMILQQIDGNIIAPKILGNSTGLSSFWVIFSVMIFGGTLGIFGLVIGVPVFAVIYAAFRSIVNQMLAKKGLPTSTLEYLDVTEIRNQRFYTSCDEEKEKSETAVTKVIASIKKDKSEEVK